VKRSREKWAVRQAANRYLRRAMVVLKKCTLLVLILVSGLVLHAQDDPLDNVLDSLVRVNHVKELRIDLRSIDYRSDTTYFIEIVRFDQRGNRIESIVPKARNRYDRRVEAYDSLNRRVLFREYDPEDTTHFHSEKIWIFQDTLNYRVEEYSEGKKVLYADVTARSSKDTMWITLDEYNLEYETHDRTVSRYRNVGDTLQISEHIQFNDQMELHGIDSYYQITRALDTGTLVMQGVLHVKESDWDLFNSDMDLMRDFYQHPEKYLQMQLDGKFEMEFDEDPFIYNIYNQKGQLVQDGEGIYKQTFTYNERGQLIQQIGWGELDGEEYSDLIPVHFTDFEYNERGLPLKVTESSVENSNTRIKMYTYKYW
jgi:hypothetical protein